VLFGLWHVVPALQGAPITGGVSDAVGRGGRPAVVLGTVGLTTVGGLAFGELRRRSGSVLASAGAHWATNALGVLSALVAWRLDASCGRLRSPHRDDGRRSPGCDLSLRSASNRRRPGEEARGVRDR
jgi:hypothetical protein